MKILVLGSKGQLGRCLNDQLNNLDHEVIYTSRKQLDIVDFEETKSRILEISPYLIVNAAAYTAVDKAEEDRKTANLVNHLAVKNIAEICKQQSIWLIHVSTDYVFDGKANIPYLEEDVTNPISVYGETKLNGELAIQASECKHIIIRTSWVYSEYGSNFLKTMLSLGAQRHELSIVGDQIGCPTYAQDIAKAILAFIQKLVNEENIHGIYHYVGETSCSWADFAEDIFKEALKQDIVSIVPKISKISTSQFPTLAKRPMYSQLNFLKYESTIKKNHSNYLDGISSTLKAIKNLKK